MSGKLKNVFGDCWLTRTVLTAGATATEAEHFPSPITYDSQHAMSPDNFWKGHSARFYGNWKHKISAQKEAVQPNFHILILWKISSSFPENFQISLLRVAVDSDSTNIFW